MAEWSVIGTQMHYVQHPHSQEGLLLIQCEEKIESQIMGKMEKPNLLSLEGESNGRSFRSSNSEGLRYG